MAKLKCYKFLHKNAKKLQNYYFLLSYLYDIS